MSTALTVDRKKYVRLANRILLKAIETEAEMTISDSDCVVKTPLPGLVLLRRWLPGGRGVFPLVVSQLADLAAVIAHDE